MTLRKYKQSRKMRKHPRKSLKSRRVAKRRKNVRRTRRGGRRGPDLIAKYLDPDDTTHESRPFEYKKRNYESRDDVNEDVRLHSDKPHNKQEPIEEEKMLIEIDI